MSAFVFPATRGPIRGVGQEAVPEADRKPKAVSDLEKKLSEGEKLLGRVTALEKHWTRFAKFTWYLDMLFFFLAVLFFHMAIWYQAIKGFLPLWMCEFFEPIFITSSGRFSDEMKQWCFGLLWLLALPIGFDIVLSVVCRISSAAVGSAAEGIKARTSEKWDEDSLESEYYHLIGDLDSVGKRNPTDGISPWPYRIAAWFFMVPNIVAAIAFCFSDDGSFSGRGFTVGIFFIALTAGLLAFIHKVKADTLLSCFTNKKIQNDISRFRKEIDPVFSPIGDNLQKKKKAAKLEAADELYERATMRRVIDEDLMAQAAEKGSPRANLYLGRKMLIGIDSGEYTDREIRDICKKAGHYLVHALSIPDGKVLFVFTELKTEYHNEKEWTRTLGWVRETNKAGLSPEGRKVYDYVVDQLVSKANDEYHRPVDYQAIARRMAASGTGGSSGYSSDYHTDLDMVQSSMHESDPHFDWRDAGE